MVRFDRGALPGFVQAPDGFGTGFLELLSPQGSLTQIPFPEIKAVCFVRDFENGETWRNHRAFSTRPKSAGLWVRLRFRDGDWMEGMLANDLLLLEPAGFSIVPPDPTFQNQRIFVPREALNNIQVLGVVGSPLRKRIATSENKRAQINLFEGSN